MNESKAALAESLLAVAADLLGGRIEPSDLTARLKPIALAGAQERRQLAIAGVGAPSGPATAKRLHREAAQRLFEVWRLAVDKPRAKPNKERLDAVQARLREGYTEAEVRRGIEGCGASAFHMGENKQSTEYNDLTLICRNGSTLEKFIGLGGGAVDNESDAVRVLRQQVRAAMKKGDEHGYERANERLREALRADRG